jgi:hypothetical protein
LIILFNETSEFTQNLIKVLNDLVQWDQWIYSKPNESTRWIKDTFLVMILKLLKPFDLFQLFQKKILSHFIISDFFRWKNGGYYSLIHPSKHPWHAILPTIHPSIRMAVHDWLISLMMSFLNINSVTTWFFLEKLKLCLCSLLAFLLDVSGSK